MVVGSYLLGLINEEMENFSPQNKIATAQINVIKIW